MRRIATCLIASVVLLSMTAISEEQKGAAAQPADKDAKKDPRDEVIKKASELRNAAKDYMKASLAEWEQNASATVKTASEKVVELKKSFGSTLNSLADAYEKQDKKASATLEELRYTIEKQMDIADKEKHVAARIDCMQKRLSESKDSNPELTKLYETLKKNGETYLDLSRKINEMDLQRSKLERESRKLEREFEITKQKQKLQKMEKDLQDGVDSCE